MPSAKRNSYRVARLVGAATQGSVLRPQPWAVKSQLHYLSAPHSAAPVTFSSELLLLAGGKPKAPPQPSPRGGSSFLLCLRRLDKTPSPWGRLEWGFYWCALPLRRVGEWGSKKQPSVIVITLGCFLVPRAGVEPARIAPLVFETSASTDSAIWATLSNNSDAKVRHFSELTNFFSEKRKNACAIRG